MEKVKIILKSGKDQSVRRYHPWIFSGAIKKIFGNPLEGDLVEVFDNKDNFLALGHYQPGSIAVRILSFEQREADSAFFKEKIMKAVACRKYLGLTESEETNVFRLVHAEGDDLPGLVIDYYNGVAVLQIHSVGMYRMRNEIANLLKTVLGEKLTAVYDKSEDTLPYMSGIRGKNEYLLGGTLPLTVMEKGLLFNVDFISGQKTGFFIDQRENRELLTYFTKGKDVLNLFGYTGAFSVYALKNARLVHTVDSSGPAIDMADENVRLNYKNDKRHRAVKDDAFEFIKDIKNKYDVIILDPPAFAKHNKVLSNALQGYKRLNMKAIEQVRPGGIIFTFSCSQVVTKDNFRKSVFAAAANTGRKVRILYQMSQPPDHPVNIYHPEGEYLKGLVLYVE